MKLIEEEFFKRNKKIIIISFVIFIVCALIGGVVTGILTGENGGKITKALMEMPKNGTNQDLGFTVSFSEIFIHNLTVSIMIILGGILFSVISVLITIFNAFSIGTPFGSDFTFAALSILPHSLFEYSATSLSLAVAFMITKLEIKMIKERSFMATLRESRTEVKDILLLIIVIVVLLFIAALIEGFITPMIVTSYFGL